MVVHRNLEALQASPNLAAVLLVADGDRLPEDPTLNLGRPVAFRSAVRGPHRIGPSWRMRPARCRRPSGPARSASATSAMPSATTTPMTRKRRRRTHGAWPSTPATARPRAGLDGAAVLPARGPARRRPRRSRSFRSRSFRSARAHRRRRRAGPRTCCRFTSDPTIVSITVAADTHPHFGARSNVNVDKSIPTVSSASPCCRSDAAMLQAPSASDTTASGTLSQKIQRQPTVSVRSPISGPAALPNPAMP